MKKQDIKHIEFKGNIQEYDRVVEMLTPKHAPKTHLTFTPVARPNKFRKGMRWIAQTAAVLAIGIGVGMMLNPRQLYAIPKIIESFMITLGLMEAPPRSVAFTINGVDFEFVEVEGGSFKMGATGEQLFAAEEKEKPVHEEQVDSFFIGKYEITQKQWKAVMSERSNPSYNTGDDNCPVERVSWYQAQRFIIKLNLMTGKTFRLPTEAEWEYAARGGNRSKRYVYSGSNKLDEVGWYVDSPSQVKYGEKGTTYPVGLKKGNELGLFDMSGNVWEWCEDAYTKDYVQNRKRVHRGWPFPGTYLHMRKVIRGGSWGGLSTGCRVSYIDFDAPNYCDEYGGFRLVYDPRPKETKVENNE